MFLFQLTVTISSRMDSDGGLGGSTRRTPRCTTPLLPSAGAEPVFPGREKRCVTHSPAFQRLPVCSSNTPAICIASYPGCIIPKGRRAGLRVHKKETGLEDAGEDCFGREGRLEIVK